MRSFRTPTYTLIITISITLNLISITYTQQSPSQPKVAEWSLVYEYISHHQAVHCFQRHGWSHLQWVHRWDIDASVASPKL